MGYLKSHEGEVWRQYFASNPEALVEDFSVVIEKLLESKIGLNNLRGCGHDGQHTLVAYEKLSYFLHFDLGGRGGQPHAWEKSQF